MSKKKKIDFFYKIIFKGGEEIITPYDFKKGEKEEYIKICENAKDWGGIPLDVNWARGTKVYQESENNLKNKI